MNSKLPSLPSALIRLALADLRKCEADPQIEIDMGDWLYSGDEHCFACLAGAVMLKSLQCPLPDSRWGFTPSSKKTWDYQDSRALGALDDFRAGFIRSAVDQMDLLFPEDVPNFITIAEYEDDPAQFHADMEALAKTLEEHNL